MTCPECGWWLGVDGSCSQCIIQHALQESRREAVRREMNRRMSVIRATADSSWRPWHDWFHFDASEDANDKYLGTRSSRTGPDPVGAARRCGCEQCRPAPEATGTALAGP